MLYKMVPKFIHKCVWGKDSDRKGIGTLRKTCPGVDLPTTNFTWGDMGSKPGLGGEIQASDRPTHFRPYND